MEEGGFRSEGGWREKGVGMEGGGRKSMNEGRKEEVYRKGNWEERREEGKD